MAKAIFRTERLNELERKKRSAWLIFPSVMCLVLFTNLISGGLADNFRDGISWMGLSGFLLLEIISAFVIGIWPFLIVRAGIYGSEKSVLENCSFINIRNIEYYRDKLTGVHPITISLLTDLKIEWEKDLAACVLWYEQLGILKEKDGKYLRCDRNEKEKLLYDSDRFLLEKIAGREINAITDGITDAEVHNWKELVIAQEKERGLLMDRPLPFRGTVSKKEQKKSWLTVVGIPLTLIIVMEAVVWLNYDAVTEMTEWLRAMPDHSTFREQMEYLAAGGTYLFLIAVMLILFLGMAVTILWPVVLHIMITRIGEEAVAYKRTDLGNQLTECIYGMKNFIHDYSSLSEADKEQLCLWDDYLIYAVVLEENKSIVEAIIRDRSKL